MCEIGCANALSTLMLIGAVPIQVLWLKGSVHQYCLTSSHSPHFSVSASFKTISQYKRSRLGIVLMFWLFFLLCAGDHPAHNKHSYADVCVIRNFWDAMLMSGLCGVHCCFFCVLCAFVCFMIISFLKEWAKFLFSDWQRKTLELSFPCRTILSGSVLGIPA